MMQKGRISLSVTTLILAVCGWIDVGDAAQRYSIQDLGAITIHSLNDRGDLVGETVEGRAIVIFWGQALQDLGWGTLVSINRQRQAVGQLEGGQFWSPGTGTLPLPTDQPDANPDPLALNDNGLIAGRIWPNCDDSVCGPGYAAVWRAGTHEPVALPGLGGFGDAVAYAVNAQGIVVGSAWLPDSQLHAYRWTESEGIQDLGTLGNVYSEAFGINALGEIVGASLDEASDISPNGVLRAFSWTPDIGMQPLEFLPDWAYSVAYAVNRWGQRVGFAWKGSGDDSGPVAVAWTRQGTPLELTTLLPASAGWLLHEAVAINALGQIIGTGMYQGQVRAFLLTPRFGKIDRAHQSRR